MTPQVSKLLKDVLEEMTDRRLRDFKWYLMQHRESGSQPVQRSQLEDSSRPETVDVLVQALGEEGALITTVDILHRMKLNDLAAKLAQAKMERDLQEEEEARLRAPRRPAARPQQDPKDLLCSVCWCVFRTPVMLQCGHSFCRRCVQQTWQGDVPRKCPYCAQVSTEAEPQVNFSLQSLSQTYLEMREEPVEIPPQDVRKNREDSEDLLQACASAEEQVQRQSRDTERRIREELQQLRRCLQTEEDRRLAALKQEEAQKIRLIQVIRKTDLSLSEAVEEMEDLVEDGSFLKNFKSSLERTQEALPHLQHPQVQVDAAKHVDNLQLRVLNKMLRSIFRSSPPQAAASSPRLLPPASAHAARAHANTHWRIFEGPMKVVQWFLSWVWTPADSW